MRVLIADDSAIVTERVANMVSELSEEIQVVGKAQDVPGAVDAVRELRPDVVILDIQMPGGSGFDVLHSIKADRPDTIVVILTNYPYPQYREKCVEGGAEFFFDKSTEFDKVCGTLQQLHRESQRRVPCSNSLKKGER